MVATDGETGKGIGYARSFHVIYQVWNKRIERPNVGGVSISST